MTYETPSCAYCPPTIRACREGESETRGPGFCPSKVDDEGIDAAVQVYQDPFVRRVAHAAALVESEGYCRWSRVEEIVALARKLGYRKLGIATCISFVDLAHTLSAILDSHRFEVASVACKNGGVPKQVLALSDADKIRPGCPSPKPRPSRLAKPFSSSPWVRAGSRRQEVVALAGRRKTRFSVRQRTVGGRQRKDGARSGWGPSGVLDYAAWRR
jgi:Protein of unknown function (DUF1847)